MSFVWNSAGVGSWCFEGRTGYLSLPGQILSWECWGGASSRDHATFIFLTGILAHAISPRTKRTNLSMFTEAAQAKPLELTTNASILQKILCLQIVSPFGSVMEKKIFRIELCPSDENWCEMELQRCDDTAQIEAGYKPPWLWSPVSSS